MTEKPLGENIVAEEPQAPPEKIILQPLPSPEIETREGESGVKLHFVLVDHYSEGAKEIAEALADADVVALEMVGSSPEERETIVQIVDALARAAPDAQESLSSLKALNEKINNPFLREFFWHLRGSKKKFYTIDAAQSDPIHQSLEKLDEIYSNYIDTIFLVPQEARRVLTDYIELYSSANKAREEIVKVQIRTIIEKESQEREGASFALDVIEGMGHTRPFHAFARTEEKASRSFSPRLPPLPLTRKDAPTVSYNYILETIRQKMFFPDRPLSPESLDRVILENYLQTISGLPAYFSTHEEGFLTRKIIDDFTDDDRRKILDGISIFLSEYRAVIEKNLEVPDEADPEAREKILFSQLRQGLADNLRSALQERFQRPLPRDHITYTLFLALLDERRRARKASPPAN